MCIDPKKYFTFLVLFYTQIKIFHISNVLVLIILAYEFRWVCVVYNLGIMIFLIPGSLSNQTKLKHHSFYLKIHYISILALMWRVSFKTLVQNIISFNFRSFPSKFNLRTWFYKDDVKFRWYMLWFANNWSKFPLIVRWRLIFLWNWLKNAQSVQTMTSCTLEK